MNGWLGIGEPSRPAAKVIFHDDFEGANANVAGRITPIGARLWTDQTGGTFRTLGGSVQCNPGSAGDNDIRIDVGQPLKGVTIETRCDNYDSATGILINCSGFTNLVQVLPNSGGNAVLWQQVNATWSQIASSSTPVDMTKPWYVDISADGDTITLRDYTGAVKLLYSTPTRPLRDYNGIGLHSFGGSTQTYWQYITVRKT